MLGPHFLEVGDEITLRLCVAGSLSFDVYKKLNEERGDLGVVIVPEKNKGDLIKSDVAVVAELPANLSIKSQKTEKIGDLVKYELTILAELPGRSEMLLSTNVNGELHFGLKQFFEIADPVIH